MADKNTKPWLEDVEGEQVPQIIERDADIILVEAGPGTGKTYGLARRVQRILHPDGLNVPGKKVLVVAFNRVIAKQLSQEINDCLKNSPHVSEPVIRTVHALCLELLGGNLRILLPHEEEAMIYDVLCKYEKLKSMYKNYRHAKQAFHYHVAKLEDHFQLGQAADEWIIQHDAQLIGDLPSHLGDRLKGGDFSDNTYQHIIVDEFQDLTPGEKELFLELRGERGKLVALGDPRQSIYAFRGNDPEGLNKISKLPASSKKISMTECRRCPAEIVEAANRLMGLYETEPMVPTSKISPNTHVVYWKSEISEAKGMAKAIVENIEANPEDDHHLAMVTRRQFGYWLREQIHKLNPDLKIDLSFSESLLETWTVREAFLYFCLMADPDSPTWRAWLGYKNSDNGTEFKPTKRNADAYLKFLDECKDKITVMEIEQLANSSKQPPGTGGKNLWNRAKRFVELKKKLQWNGEDALAFLNEVFDTNKWGGEQSPDPETSRLDMELLLSKAVDIYQKLEDRILTEHQKLMKVALGLRYQIATREPFLPDEESDLQVATLWGAKGVTADHVYVIGLCNETMPGTPRDDYPLRDEDYFKEQKRLFYVSITRSRRTLVLSRSKTIPNGRAKQLGLSTSKGNQHRRFLKMSRYLRDIIKFLPRAQKGEEWDGCV